jgi:tetratricopeptide (TPR) repeat protein
MEPNRSRLPKSARWPGFLAVAYVAVAASVTSVGNHWAQDDIAIVLRNGLVHDLSNAASYFAQPYWPPPFAPYLYRPLALLTLALQWSIADEAPLVFRIGSIVIYAACSLAVFTLLRRLVGVPVALAGAALFAAHPVHVESVAMAVNQAELWVGIVACMMTWLYLHARRAGTMNGREQLVLAGLFLMACLFKENAVMIPALLVAAEVLLVDDVEPWRARIRRLRPFFLLLALVAVGFVGVRTSVLGGSVAGTFPAEALNGLTLWERVLTMLQVVPHWFRLLAWPAHLQADYSPQEINTAFAWGTVQTFAVGLLLAALLLLMWAWRRAPVLAFGLAWVAVALFPVHNVLVPTGIVLAERTLFLPSVGAIIAASGLAAFLIPRGTAAARFGLALAAGTLVVLGVYKSAAHHPMWEDQITLFYHMANRDAPLSYRAHHGLAEMYWVGGAKGRAVEEYRLAIALAPPNVSYVKVDYAHKLRQLGFCETAVTLYRDALKISPGNMSARASFVSCLIELGHYDEAAVQARLGIGLDARRDTWQWLMAKADSAIAVGAPAGSIKIPVFEIDSAGREVNPATPP